MTARARTVLLRASAVVSVLLAVLTAGGPVLVGVAVLEASTGGRPDGIGLIVPGLVATLGVAALASASVVAVARAARRPARAVAVVASTLATLPVLLAAVTAVGTTRYWSADRTLGLRSAWWQEVGPAAVTSTAAVACLVGAGLLATAAPLATRPGRARVRLTDGPRRALLGTALVGLVVAAVLDPRLLTVTFLSGPLTVQALLVRPAPDPAS